jgi:hypothetical protein
MGLPGSGRRASDDRILLSDGLFILLIADRYRWLSIKTVRRFLISRGFRSEEPIAHEDKLVQPLAASNIRRTIRFPELELLGLRGCREWRDPLRR